MPSGEEILALVERIDQASNDLENEAIERLHRQMDGAFRALEKELRTTYPELQSIGGLVAAQRKTLVLEKLGAALDLLDPTRAGTYTQLFQELLTTSNSLGGSLADQMLGLYQEDVAALDPFTGIAAEAIANVASESVQRLYRYSEDFRDKASVIVGQGIIQGWGAAKVATALRGELGLAKGKAETIARTEVMSALNQGAIARYQEAGIEHVQWIIAPSEGLCGYCANRNMQVYKASEVVYPIHPRCRCSLSPYSPKWQALGLTDDAFAEQYRQEGIKELEARGGKLQSGPTSFEKNAGLDAPPQAVWSPGDASKREPAHVRLMRAGQEEVARLGNNPSLEQLAELRSQLLSQLPPEQAAKLAGDAGISSDVAAMRRAENGERKGEENIRLDLEEFHRLTGGTARGDVALLKVAGEDRAWADPETGEINLGRAYSESALFHEMGHMWEADNPGLNEAAWAWRDSRATGPAKPLNDITGTDIYDPSEMALPGRFADPYVAKVYPDGSTEVISVGMEHFVTPQGMKILLENDPEHFALMVGAMKEAQAARLNQGATPTDQPNQKQQADQPRERLFSGWNGYRPLTPVEEAMQRSQAKRAEEFQDYLRREEESIRRRTSGEIDRKLREYHDAEAARLREMLGLPSPAQAKPAPKPSPEPTPQRPAQPASLEIRSYDRDVPPVRRPTLEVDESSLSAKGKAALKVVRDYESVIDEINDTISRIPGPDKTLPADAYGRIYDKIDNLTSRLTGLVNEAKEAMGTAGNAELEARLSQIGKISKEALPGYKIQSASDDLKDKSAVRPC